MLKHLLLFLVRHIITKMFLMPTSCTIVHFVLYFKHSKNTMILQWSILFFLTTINVPNIQCFYVKCFGVEKCEKSLEIKTQKESNNQYNPLYLLGKHGSYKLAVPEAEETGTEEEKNVKVHFTEKEKLIYACPKTLKNNVKEKVSPALAQQNDIKITKESESELVDKNCSQRVEPTMRSLNKSCGVSESSADEFHLYEIGFKVFIRHRSMINRIISWWKKEETEKFTWHRLYEICHNTKLRSTLYTTHILHGASVGASSGRFQGKFDDVDEVESMDGTKSKETIDTKSVSMDKIFQQKSVQELFQAHFGKKGSSYFNKKEHYLAKGHLVPDADMSFIPWKNATYLYPNVVPMWQVVNNGIWRRIEQNIRKFAKETKETLTIYTGVYQILSYDEKKIFLGGKDTSIMAVPSYLWKVVHNVKKNQAIAMVVNNDPHTDRSPCPLGEDPDIREDLDICDRSGSFKNRNQIVLVCCYLVENLHKTIPYIPKIKNAEILKIMQKPKSKNKWL